MFGGYNSIYYEVIASQTSTNCNRLTWSQGLGAYLSSSEAYTNNWGLFGKENYLTFDWWKHFLKIFKD
jgi:hypothetical protein